MTDTTEVCDLLYGLSDRRKAAAERVLEELRRGEAKARETIAVLEQHRSAVDEAAQLEKEIAQLEAALTSVRRTHDAERTALNDRLRLLRRVLSAKARPAYDARQSAQLAQTLREAMEAFAEELRSAGRDPNGLSIAEIEAQLTALLPVTAARRERVQAAAASISEKLAQTEEAARRSAEQDARVTQVLQAESEIVSRLRAHGGQTGELPPLVESVRGADQRTAISFRKQFLQPLLEDLKEEQAIGLYESDPLIEVGRRFDR